METATMLVPSSARPSLIGSKGNKINDIMATSGATVSLGTSLAGATTTTAYIKGSPAQIQTAISLLKVAVLHAHAAHSEPPPATTFQVSRQSQASYDLYMFAHETNNLSFSNWSK